MMKKNLLLVSLLMAVFSLCLAQEKKVVPEEEGLTRKAIVIANQNVRLDKEQVFEGKYLQNETDMAYRNQAKEKALVDFSHKYKTSIIVDPFVTVKKKKGYFIVTVKGFPMREITPDLRKVGKEGLILERKMLPREKMQAPEKRP